MAQANELDSWSETFIISVMKKDGAAASYSCMITTYDITGGDKDFTTIANGCGGRIKKFETQSDYEVTLEGYATQVGNGAGFFDLQHSGAADEAQPLLVPVDHSRDEFLISIMHTTDTAATSAVVASTQDERALRDTFKNGHFTGVAQSFTDGVCKFTLKFKAGPFAKDASSNVSFESTDGSATSPLPAITYVTA